MGIETTTQEQANITETLANARLLNAQAEAIEFETSQKRDYYRDWRASQAKTDIKLTGFGAVN